MRWNEIINEGSDFNCPNCGEYLGKASEIELNNSRYCGNCGWSDRKPEPKAVPKSKQPTDKTSGDYSIRINSTKTQADLTYNGTPVSIIRPGDGAGTATMMSKGVYVASWKVDFYNSHKIPGQFPTLTQAINAVKRMHQSKVKEYMKARKKSTRRVGEMIDEDVGSLFMGVSSIPDWSQEDERYVLVFSNKGGHEAKVHRDENGISAEVDNSWDKGFSDEASAEAWLKGEGYTNFVGVDDE